MLKLKKIAVTGGLASGKTSVCRILETKCNAYVVSADSIVHELLTSDPEIIRKTTQLLGSNILENGHLIRSKIAEIVFSDMEKLQELERLLHPVVIEKIEKLYQQVKNSLNYSFFVAEVPLLFECHLESRFDFVITVISGEEMCQQRFLKAGGSKEEYSKRTNRQTPMSDKAKKAHFVINNCGSIEDLTQQVLNISQKLISM